MNRGMLPQVLLIAVAAILGGVGLFMFLVNPKRQERDAAIQLVAEAQRKHDDCKSRLSGLPKLPATTTLDAAIKQFDQSIPVMDLRGEEARTIFYKQRIAGRINALIGRVCEYSQVPLPTEDVVEEKSVSTKAGEITTTTFDWTITADQNAITRIFAALERDPSGDADQREVTVIEGYSLEHQGNGLVKARFKVTMIVEITRQAKS